MTRQALEKQLAEMIRRVSTIPTFTKVREIWAFGSYIDGKDRPNDLDLFVRVDVDHDAWLDFVKKNNIDLGSLDPKSDWTSLVRWALRGKAGRGGGTGVLTGLSLSISREDVRHNSLVAKKYLLLWRDGVLLEEADRELVEVSKRPPEEKDDYSIRSNVWRCRDGLRHEVQQRLRNLVVMEEDTPDKFGEHGRLVVKWPEGEKQTILHGSDIRWMALHLTDIRQALTRALCDGIGDLKWKPRLDAALKEADDAKVTEVEALR